MKDYIEIDGKQVQLPNLALGAEYPFVVDRMKQLEEEKVRAEKKARLYFWDRCQCSLYVWWISSRKVLLKAIAYFSRDR